MDVLPLDDICRRHRVVLIVQFGSTVDGNAHPGSDLDLAALTEVSPSIDAFLALLSDLQGVFAGHDIDLSSVNTADPLFLKKMLERPRLLYGSEARLAELKLYAFKRYQDHLRFLDLERRYVEDGLRKRVAK